MHSSVVARTAILRLKCRLSMAYPYAEVVHIDHIVGKYVAFIDWSKRAYVRTQLIFSHIVNTRFIDKTINFTSGYDSTLQRL